MLATMVIVGSLFSGGAQATVLWDGFRGQGYFPASAGPAILPNYNNLGNVRQYVDNLLAFGTNSANIQDAITRGNTGSAAQINFLDSDNQTCDVGTAPGSTACQRQILGNIFYTAILFPEPGTYVMQFARDDNVLMQSAATGGTDYRNLTYGTEVGYGGPTGQNNFSSIGSITTTQPNTIINVRIVWNNWGNSQSLQMRWLRPNGTLEIVPPGNLLDPSNPATYPASGVASVPTLGQWVLALLASLVMALGLRRMRSA